MAAKPHKSCRPRSTSPLAGVRTLDDRMPQETGSPRPAGRRAAHLRSVAGRGHAQTARGPVRQLPGVTWVPIRVGIRVVVGVPIPVSAAQPNNSRNGAPKRSEIARANYVRRGRSEGRNRPRRGRDPAPGRVRPMPSPGGNTTRPDRRRRQGHSSSAAARRRAGTARGARAACGRSTLTPGRAGWSRGHRSGVPPDAQRHPPGEGAAVRSDQRM